LRKQEILQPLLQLLNKKWEQLQDNDRNMLTLFECFESVVRAIKEEVEQFAPVIFSRCCKILTSVLSSLQSNYKALGNESQDSGFIEVDFYIRSMDLISSLISALKGKAEPLILQSNLVPLMQEFFGIPDLCIR